MAAVVVGRSLGGRSSPFFPEVSIIIRINNVYNNKEMITGSESLYSPAISKNGIKSTLLALQTLA